MGYEPLFLLGKSNALLKSLLSIYYSNNVEVLACLAIHIGRTNIRADTFSFSQCTFSLQEIFSSKAN